MRINNVEGQVSMFGPDMVSGKMSPEHFQADETPRREKGTKDETSKQFSRRSCRLKNHTFMLLDQRPGAGNMLGPYWEYDPPWLGLPGTLNTSECPKAVVESFLSQILQDTAPSKYSLSRRACLGILRRANERGKPLPAALESALLVQARMGPPLNTLEREEFLHADNQRNGVRSPEDLSTTLASHPGLKRNAFAAGFSAGAGSSAGSLGYQEELTPTIKGGESGNCMPAVLCLNDQGGKAMAYGKNTSGTLRAQEHGHQPVVLYENHGIDARYRGPLETAPTISARYGTGGDNVPLVSQKCETIYITGNAIDGHPKDEENGIGYQANFAYTPTATDRHAVFRRQRVDSFCPDDIASTQSARQRKDATDLICTILPSLQADKPFESTTADQARNQLDQRYLIRRLMPLECERLQGYPDGWTDLPYASDSSRYKALGNSVAIPCVEYLMRGIEMALRGNIDFSYLRVDLIVGEHK